MNIDNIVGVKYVGKKDRQEDTVCKTGAVWKPGQVLNFSASLAKRLFVHTDSFAEAAVAMDAPTFLSGAKTVRGNKDDVAAVVNLTGMGIEQMALFARVEFGRTINTDGKDEEQVRREVHALMSNRTIDDEAQRREAEKAADGRAPFTYMATAEEAEALRAGVVVLGLVPAEVANYAPPADEKPETQVSDTAPDGSGSGSGDGDQPPTLDVLLASLDKKGLMAFARQEGVSFYNSITADKLREKLFTELSARKG